MTDPTRPLSWYGECAPDSLEGEEDPAEERRREEEDHADEELHRRYERE